MNKYQKALETLMSSNIKLCVYDDVDYEQQPTLFDLYHSELFTLQELVNKAVPKKVESDKYYDEIADNLINEYYCPCCNSIVGKKDNYCSCCGQRLDWGEDDEND